MSIKKADRRCFSCSKYHVCGFRRAFEDLIYNKFNIFAKNNALEIATKCIQWKSYGGKK